MELAILAVTRLSDGVCVAGIDRDWRWVRPTRPAPTEWWPERRLLTLDDCRDGQGEWVVRKGNVVDLDVQKPIPKGSHVEDWLVGTQPPKLVRTLPEARYRRVCARIAGRSVRRLFVKKKPCSLVMIKPEAVTSFLFETGDDRNGKRRYLPRVSFRAAGQLYRDLAVTDAEWRAHGRDVMKTHGDPYRLDGRAAIRDLATKDCWLAVGRYEMDGHTFLLVVKIHLFPVCTFQMDFRR